MDITLIAIVGGLAIAVLLGMAIFLRSGKQQDAKLPSEFSLKSRFMGLRERNFYVSIAPAIADSHILLFKIPASSLMDESVSANVIKAYDKLFLDFIMVDKSQGTMTAAIELREDNVYQSDIERFCEYAGLGYFALDPNQNYHTPELRKRLLGMSESIIETDSMRSSTAGHGDKIERHSESNLPKCPKCQSKTAIKIAAKGEHFGKRFLMCKQYPYCDFKVLLGSKVDGKKPVNLDDQTVEIKGFAKWSRR